MVFPLLFPIIGLGLAGIAGGIGLSSAGASVRYAARDGADSLRNLSASVSGAARDVTGAVNNGVNAWNNGIGAVTVESLRWHGTFVRGAENAVQESRKWRGTVEHGTEEFKQQSEKWREGFERTHKDWLRQSEAWQAESGAWRFFAVTALSDVALGIEHCMKLVVLVQGVWAVLIIFCFWALGEVIWQAARPGGRGEGATNPFTRVLVQLAALTVGVALGAVLLRAYVYVYATYSRGDLVFAAMLLLVCCAAVARLRGGYFTVSTVVRAALVCAVALVLWREVPIGAIVPVYDPSGVPPSGYVRMDGSSGGPILERGMTLTSSGGAAPYFNPVPRVATRLVNAKIRHIDTLARESCNYRGPHGNQNPGLLEKAEFGHTIGHRDADFNNGCSFYTTREASFAPGTETVAPGHREPITDAPLGLATPMYMYVGHPMRALLGTALALLAAWLVPLDGGVVTGVVEGKIDAAAEDDAEAAAVPVARRDASDWQFWIQPLALLMPVALVAGLALQGAFQ